MPRGGRQPGDAQERAVARDDEVHRGELLGREGLELAPPAWPKDARPERSRPGANRSISAAQLASKRGRRHQQARPPRRARSRRAARAAATAPGWSCPGPCRRRGRRRGRAVRAGAASGRRPAGRAAGCRAGRARDRSAPALRASAAPSGSRRATGPRRRGTSPGRRGRGCRPRRCRRRPASASPRRSRARLAAASRSASRKRSIVRPSRSRSTSTHWPRISARPLVLARSSFISAAVSGSPSRVTSMRKSSSASLPSPDGALPPTVAVTCGRDGRLALQVAGMRTTTPARSSSGTSPRKRRASCGVQRSGWKISPASTISLSQAQRSAARCTGSSSERSRSLLAAPAYSRSAWPSGRCWALPCADSRVV